MPLIAWVTSLPKSSWGQRQRVEGIMEAELLTDPLEMELLLDIGVEVDVGSADIGEVLETSGDAPEWKRRSSPDNIAFQR